MQNKLHSSSKKLFFLNFIIPSNISTINKNCFNKFPCKKVYKFCYAEKTTSYKKTSSTTNVYYKKCKQIEFRELFRGYIVFEPTQNVRESKNNISF